MKRTAIKTEICLTICGNSYRIFSALRQKGLDKFYDEFNDTKFNSDDEDGEVTGEISVSNIRELSAVMVAFAKISVRVDLFIRTPKNEQDGFSFVMGNDNIYAEWFCDSEKMLDDAEGKIKETIKLLSSI